MKKNIFEIIELKAFKDVFEQVYKTTGIPVCIVDKNCNVQFINGLVAEFFETNSVEQFFKDIINLQDSENPEKIKQYKSINYIFKDIYINGQKIYSVFLFQFLPHDQEVKMQPLPETKLKLVCNDIINNTLDLYVQLLNSFINEEIINIELKEALEEQELIQEQISNHLKEQQIISDSANAFIRMKSLEEIYEYLAGLLDTLSGAEYIIISLLDTKKNTINVRKTIGINHLIESTLKKFGIDIYTLEIPVSQMKEKELEIYKDGNLIKFENGLFGLSARKIPKLICNVIENIAGAESMYTMGFTWNNQLFGGVTLIYNKKLKIINKLLLETIIKQATIAIQRRYIEKELIASKEKAEENDRLKSQFLNNISHEIRTPMNSILGFSQLLDSDKLSPEKRKDFLIHVKKSTNQLLRLINDIIEVSKIETKQIEIKPSRFFANAFINDIYVFYKYELEQQKKTDIELRITKISGISDYYIWADPIRLKQIFTNLLNNAIKFTTKGIIEISGTIYNSTTFLFFVRDTGKGIKPQNIDLIFERFRQEDESNTRQFGGTGLGLALSKGLVEAMGGKIWVESEVDRGSTFYFTIPQQHPIQSRLDETKEPQIQESKTDHEDKKILIVEDTQANLLYLQEILSITKATVLIARNGKEAVDIFYNNQDISLILMDIQMPVMNGDKATKQIRLFNKTVPIIAQTAHAFADEHIQYLEAGCNDYITKPYDSEDIINKVIKFLT